MGSINALPPSLTNELADLKRRVTSLERKPETVSKFDRYPAVEWAAIGRGRTGDNQWSSCGIANVTGMVFDRVEAKFITDRLTPGRAEAEVRLAAFRHNLDVGNKECISASSTIQLTGMSTRVLGLVYVRWIHQIPFGWDYADETNIYTIELQHRYATAMTADKVNVRQMFGYSKMSNENLKNADGIISDGTGKVWSPGLTAINGGVPYYGWVDVQDRNDVWDGSYNISNMHYCVGLPADRLPTASTLGHWRWRGTEGKKVRDPDINESYMTV